MPASLPQVLKPGAKIMMMGTPEAVTAALDAQAEVAPHVQDDFNVAAGVLEDPTDFVDREENQVPRLVALPLLDKRSASTARDTRHGRCACTGCHT